VRVTGKGVGDQLPDGLDHLAGHGWAIASAAIGVPLEKPLSDGVA